MTVLIAPDKFKGTIDSSGVCAALEKGLRRADPSLVIRTFPMADGGDGFAGVMAHYQDAEKIVCKTVDALGRPIEAFYYYSAKKQQAIIELAAASGLVLISPADRDIMKANTVGTGVLIRDAVVRGAREIVLGVGGSATNDGGTGILYALGFDLLDANGSRLEPSASNLSVIHKVLAPEKVANVKFTLAVDVDNPLTGERGAAAVYAPQKGANEEQVRALEQGLQQFADIILEQTGNDVAKKAGMGAAGGVPAGLMAFLDVAMINGAELVINASGIRSALPDASLVITGEGKIDSQTSAGKLAASVAAVASEYGVSCVAVCGVAELGAGNNFQKIIQLIDHAPEEKCTKDPGGVLENIAGLLLNF